MWKDDENDNKKLQRFMNLVLHRKINAGRPIKNILYWLKETQRVHCPNL